MRLGLALGVAGLPLADAAAIARDAEAAGAGTVAVGEASVDTFAVAALLATATSRARVLSGVATWARPPVLTAMSAATVDELAGGRYTLGLGPMPPAWNRDWYGIDPTRPLARMREYVEVVRGALRTGPGRPLDVQGEHFQVRGYARMHPAYRPDVPVHLAATRPGMARLAGEVADGVLVNWLHTVPWLAGTLLPAVASGEAAGGTGESGADPPRRCERGVMVRTHVDGDRRRALSVLRGSFTPYLDVPYLAEVAATAGWDARALPEEMVAGMTVTGDQATALERLAAYEGLVDWVELVPAGGLDAGGLRAAYDGLLGLIAAAPAAVAETKHQTY